MSQRTKVVLFRTMVLGICSGAALGAGAVPAGAQLPPVPEEMGRLDFLVGDWEGEGWMEVAPGQRAGFTGTERVEHRMGGRVVVVEGAFTVRMGPERGEVPVHQALGVFSWDPEADGFTFRTWTARGGHGEAHPAEITDGRIVWGYEDPRMGTVRYTITLTPDGAWHEIGEASSDDGVSWHQFFEMTLARTGMP